MPGIFILIKNIQDGGPYQCQVYLLLINNIQDGGPFLLCLSKKSFVLVILRQSYKLGQKLSIKNCINQTLTS